MPVVALLIALALTVGATTLYLPLARRRRWVDAPNERSAHREQTPNSGGLAIAASLAVSFVVFGPLVSGSLLLPAPALVAWLCFVIIGALDDRLSLPIAFRLSCYLGLAVLAVSPIFPFDEYGLVSALAALGLTWLVNLFNFMDGIDGIASLQCLLTSFTLSILLFITGSPRELLVFSMIIAGAYGGFLMFNWPQARLFMGDAGSLPGGLLLGVQGLALASADVRLGLAWVLLMSPFLLDTSFTLVRRAMQGKRITQAHREHVYQHLFRRFGALAVDRGLLLLHGLWLAPLAGLCALTAAPVWTLLTASLFPQLLLIAWAFRLK
ncbi:MAG: glycosyl transferase family 4 [Pseudomonadota bacterium]